MKAFDVIGAIKEDQSEDNYTVQREYFNVDQKEQIRVPFVTKIQVDSICHEIRKPKFHLVKPKQPPIHVINSKSTSVLGLDTQNQTWTTGTTLNYPPPQGFFSMFKNASPNDILAHNNQLENERRVFNPFQLLRERFGHNQQQNTFQQQVNHSIVPNFQDDKIKPVANMNPPEFLGYQNNPDQQYLQDQNHQLQMTPSNPNQPTKLQRGLIESQVQQVHLHDLPKSFRSHQNQEREIGQKITSFFASLANKFGNKKESQIQKAQSHQDQIREEQSNENGSKIEENQNIIESQVQQYNPERQLAKTTSRQIQLVESVVIQQF